MAGRRIADRLTASLTDDGASVAVGFIDAPGGSLFACLASPEARPRAAVLVCSSIHAEAAKSYRTEVLLARTLAKRGFAVMRFHYRGQGHSNGDTDQLTFESMQEDAALAVRLLLDKTKVSELAFFGCRLGALVVASTAARHAPAPTVLWDPPFDTNEYLRLAWRSAAMNELVRSDRTSERSRTRLHELRPEERLNVSGYPIYGRFVASLTGRSLSAEMGARHGPQLLIHAGRLPSSQIDKRTVALSPGFQPGAEVSVVRTGEVGWWFTGAARQRERFDEVSATVISKSTSWLDERFTSEARS